MTRSLLSGLAMFFVLLAATACQSEEGTTVALPSGGILTGTWSRACVVVDTTDSESETLTFYPNTASYTRNLWLGETECLAALSSVTFAGEFEFFIENLETFPNGQRVSRYLSTDTAETVTANTQAAADALAGFYGVATWEVGLAVDVLNLDETGADDPPVEAERGILAINGSATPNELYFGNENDLGEDGYPDSLETTPWNR